MSVQMELSRIVISEMKEQQLIVLKEVDGERTFPIVIGSEEAFAINRRLNGFVPPRPLTHDLLASTIEKMGGTLEKIEITDLQEHIFYASLCIRQGGELIQIDSRPSDAIALGIATMVPIYVAESILGQIS